MKAPLRDSSRLCQVAKLVGRRHRATVLNLAVALTWTTQKTGHNVKRLVHAGLLVNTAPNGRKGVYSLTSEGQQFAAGKLGIVWFDGWPEVVQPNGHARRPYLPREVTTRVTDTVVVKTALGLNPNPPTVTEGRPKPVVLASTLRQPTKEQLMAGRSWARRSAFV